MRARRESTRGWETSRRLFQRLWRLGRWPAQFISSSSSVPLLGGAGRLSSSTDWLGGAAIRETDYTYDLLGRQTITSVAPKPSGTALTTTLTLDSMGPQTTVAATGTTTDTLAETYDAVGRLTSISRSGSALTTFTYNPDGGTGTGQRLFSSLMPFIKDSVADATSLTRPLASSSDGGRKPVEQEGEFAAELVGENPWARTS
jgi:hypothetical protein